MAFSPFSFDPVTGVKDTTQFPRKDTNFRVHLQDLFDQIKTYLNSTVGASSFLNNIYPIGSIYMSVNATNPSSSLGGTWVAWGAGRVPIGVGSNGTTNYTSTEATGGSDSITVDHTHTLTDAYGKYQQSASVIGSAEKTVASYNLSVKNSTAITSVANTDASTTGMQIGGSTDTSSPSIDIRQPYITCYMWKRTA